MTSDKSAQHKDSKEPVPQDLQDRSLHKIRKAASGNGIAPGKITQGDFEGEILAFEVFNVFTFEPVISEKIINGKKNGTVVGSAEEARQNINRTVNAISRDKELRKNLEESLENREDKGFAVPNLPAPLNKYKTNYVVHNVCDICAGNARVNCPQCQGQGKTQCKHCHGRQLMTCPLCKGQGQIAGPKGRHICTKCHGECRIQCVQCRGKGFTQCPTCHEAGKISCRKCNGTGWLSQIFYLEFKNKSRFEYIKSELPDKLPPLIDSLGSDFVTEKHGRVSVIRGEEIIEELESNAKNNEMIIAYDVRLPWGQVTYDIAGKEQFNGHLFGWIPTPVLTDPYLEKLAWRGLKDLHLAAEKPGDALNKIRDAGQFRLIARALIATASLSHRKALDYMYKSYPFGISSEMIKKIVKNADLALKNTTRKARITGLIVGLAINALLYGLYFIGPLRSMASAAYTRPEIHLLIDILLVLAGGTITTTAIQIFGQRSLHTALEKILPEKKRRKITPKPGKSALFGYALGAALYFVMIVIAGMTGHTVPAWMDNILSTFL